MKLKSFFADSVEAALERARKELGPEALLVYSREAPPEARGLGAYEVVFAASAGEGIPGTAGPAPGGRATAAEGSGEACGALVSAELGELRRQVGRLAAALARSSVVAPPPGSFAEAAEAASEGLIEAGLDDGFLAGLMGRLQARFERQKPPEGPALPAAVGGWLREEIEAALPVAGAEEDGLGEQAVLLAGPPGSGKTTTLAKLAARYGVERGRRVRLLSLDGGRVGAAHEIRAYAAILGAGCRFLEAPSELAAAALDGAPGELTLIDTPGYAGSDGEALAELGAALTRQPPIDVHLVLPATMKPADLRRAAERFRPLRPDRLIFTRLDETASPGSAVAEAIRSRLPVSFLSVGRRIPEDLEEASAGRLVELLAGGVARRLAGLWNAERRPAAGAGRAAAA